MRRCGVSVLNMSRFAVASGTMGVINRAVALFVLGLLLAGCGGGSSPETFTVSGTITVQSVSSAPLESAGAEALGVQRADAPGSGSPSASQVFSGQVAAAGKGLAAIAGVKAAEQYELELQKGQHIVLEFEDSAAADLHLYLLDELGVALDASVDAVQGPAPGFRSLSLLVPAAGRHVVRVFADHGHAAYSLHVYPRMSPVHEANRGPRVSDEFVVHQMLVQTHPGASSALSSRAGGVGLRKLRETAVAAELWEVPAGHAGPAMDGLRGWRPRSGDLLRWRSPDLHDRFETLLIVRGLRAQPEVVAVSPNYILRPQQVATDDPRYAEQWFHWNIDLPKAWEISTGRPDDAEVIVAVIDTGVFREHEDLQGKLLTGYDFLLDQPGGDDPGNGSWHGTHVAGIIGAATNNGVGVAGVSWGAKILPVRTLSDATASDGEARGGSLSDLLDGIRYAAGLAVRDEPAAPPRASVINLSLGGEFPCNEWQGFFREIRDLGIFVVAASGNSRDGSGAITFPASCSSVLAVGATDRERRRAGYSRFGSGLDFVAPGGRPSPSPDGILSTIAPVSSTAPETGYEFYAGTSMATAVTSGVLALAKAVDPGFTPDRFSQMLECGLLTDDLGAPGWDSETGWGQINALKTLRAVRDERDGVSHLTSGFLGRVYVRLLNAAGETVASTAVDPQGCLYPYRFEEVPEGDYWIVAGTDPDQGDGTQCRVGEACGAFPSLAEPKLVRVDRNRDGLDFAVVIER